MKVMIRHSLRKMDYLLGKTLSFIYFIRLIPHVIHYLAEEKNCPLKKDIEVWKKNYSYIDWGKSELSVFIKLMTNYPEFRNLFYYRAHWAGRFFEILCPPMKTLILNADHIGPGLFISHGFATIVSAKYIGENFYLHQQVTIGWKSGSCPTIGNNVQVGAGSIILGGITIGDNAIVGAGATAIKDVQAGCTVVGIAACNLRKKSIS